MSSLVTYLRIHPYIRQHKKYNNQFTLVAQQKRELRFSTVYSCANERASERLGASTILPHIQITFSRTKTLVDGVESAKTGKLLVGETFNSTAFTQKGGFHGTHGTTSGSTAEE